MKIIRTKYMTTILDNTRPPSNHKYNDINNKQIYLSKVPLQLT